MVLLYRGFEGSRVFRWCRGHIDRITVMFPAEAFFDRCIDRVIDEDRAGKSVLAWGDPEGLDRLKERLRVEGIAVLPFSESVEDPRSLVRRPRPTLSLSFMEKDGAAA